VLVDVRTRIVGLDRNGVPSIGSLQAVRMNAVRCGSEIVATRIVPAGPIAPPAAAEDVLGAHWRGDPGILHDRTTYIAAAIVAAAAAVVLLVRARRRPLAARRG